MMPLRIKREILFVFFLMFILAGLEVCSIFSMSFLALSIAAPDRIASVPGIAWIYAQFPFVQDLSADSRMFALLAASVVAGLIVAKNAVSALVGVRNALLGETVALYAGDVLFHYYLNSQYIAYLSGDNERIYQVFSWRAQLGFFLVNLMQVYTYLVISIGLFFVIISATPEILLLTLSLITVLCFFIYRNIKQAVGFAGEMSAKYSLQETTAMDNAKQGMMEVHIYRQQQHFFNAFHTAGEQAMKSRALITVAPPIPTWILESVAFIAIPATLWIMVALYDASMARVTAVLTMIMLASWRALPMLNRSMTNMVALRGAHFPTMQCLEMLRMVQEKPVAEEIRTESLLEFRSDIVFDEVSFRYPSARVDSLCSVSFRLQKGSSLGIIGQSGAGKSTLANILSGLVEPVSGSVYVDGRQLSHDEHAAYMRVIGYVAQKPYLLRGTLAQNVAFSEWGRPYDPERVLHACRLAKLDIVDTHPLGIELPVGGEVTGLSGGQAQRLSIARALYASPQVLILDEATSSLDLGTEAAIIKTIASLPNAITTVVIAHRLSTVEWCDAILWLRQGELAAYGPAKDVLPKYKEYLGIHEHDLPVTGENE
jgi:ABC-type multidrug transport system fused ATPase/permease subunit